jgi:hypothetical protein
MQTLEIAETLNNQIQAFAVKTVKFSNKILNKLNKFKDNNFRPRIFGVDSEKDSSSSDGEDSSSSTSGNEGGEDEMTEMQESSEESGYETDQSKKEDQLSTTKPT